MRAPNDLLRPSEKSFRRPNQCDETVSDFDRNGNLTESSDQRSGTTPFEYDPLGRITRAGGQTFAFDPAHNILDPTAQQPVSGNRLQRYNGHSYYYDDYGNTVQHESADGSQHNLYYDLYDRLEKAEVFRRNESGGWDKQTWVYQYDALDRRIRKGRLKEDGGLEDETRFVWDGSRLLQEVYARGRYTYVYADQDSYEPLAQIHNYTNAGFETYQEINYFHCDQIGIPREMTDRDGRLLWFGDYDGWGRLDGETNITGAHQPFRLQNQYCDEETGLHYNFYRYYEPNSGRFINQDPIGLNGGVNLYQFAPNTTKWIDFYGLSFSEHLRKSCGQLAKEISELVSRDKRLDGNCGTHGLKHRFREQINGANGPNTKCWKNHEDTIKNQQKGLRDRLQAYAAKGCGNPPSGSWKWATKPAPSAEEWKGGVETVAKVGGTAVGLYVGYKIIRAGIISLLATPVAGAASLAVP